jgi:hypothetical protein
VKDEVRSVFKILSTVAMLCFPFDVANSWQYDRRDADIASGQGAAYVAEFEKSCEARFPLRMLHSRRDQQHEGQSTERVPNYAAGESSPEFSNHFSGGTGSHSLLLFAFGFASSAAYTHITNMALHYSSSPFYASLTATNSSSRT